MSMHIVGVLKHLVSGQNQFAQGGLFLMLLGSVGVFLRAVPGYLWAWVVEQTTMTVTVKDDDDAFTWVKEWLLEQSFVRRVRRVDLDTTVRGEEMALIPAPGLHWFVHQKRPFAVEFFRSDDAKGLRQRRVESMRFRTLGRNPALLRRFVAGIVSSHHKRARLESSLYQYSDYWESVEAYAPRLLESVILQPGEKERLLEDVACWRASRERYRRLGVPYHRG